MVKSKEDDGSTDSGGDRDRNDDCLKSSTSSKCSHINKSIIVAKIKKILKNNGLVTTCSECEKEKEASPTVNNHEDDEYEYDKTLWLCLRCGVQLCGRTANKHALQHYEVYRYNLAYLNAKVTNDNCCL